MPEIPQQRRVGEAVRKHIPIAICGTGTCHRVLGRSLGQALAPLNQRDLTSPRGR